MLLFHGCSWTSSVATVAMSLGFPAKLAPRSRGLWGSGITRLLSIEFNFRPCAMYANMHHAMFRKAALHPSPFNLWALQVFEVVKFPSDFFGSSNLLRHVSFGYL